MKKLAVEQFSSEIFERARDRLVPLLLSAEVTEIEEEVLHIVEALDGRRSRSEDEGPVSFNEWSADDLLSAYGRLAALRVNLSRMASVAQSHSNFAMRWKIYQNSREWKPAKAALQKELDRLGEKFVKADVENVLIDAFWETTQKEVFLQEIADRLTTLYESTNQVLTSIKMRVNRLTKEELESRNAT
jgi:hypothetical protein